MNQFSGKTAVISGGAEGIGLSIAKALAEQGMNLVLADIDESNLEKAAAILADTGVETLTLKLDVANEAAWHDVAEQAQERFGKIHMVVNNAGVTGDPGPIESQQSDSWQWTLDVNLMGVVYGAKAIVPLIKQHDEGGWIVNVASMAGMGGVPYSGAYTATKAAVVALSESWAGELTKSNIKVSVLCPAFVKTRIHESYRNRPGHDNNGETSNEIANDRAANTKSMVERGIDVDIVGKRVVEALLAGEMYIFTHPNYRSVIQHRSSAIDAAFERAAKSPLLKEIVDQEIDFL
ncbi:MAG: SDR family NAD(P)-dependent oxidoreductase [Pseudomonadota bacterium]